jgi:hypothetical protein
VSRFNAGFNAHDVHDAPYDDHESAAAANRASAVHVRIAEKPPAGRQQSMQLVPCVHSDYLDDAQDNYDDAENHYYDAADDHYNTAAPEHTAQPPQY